MNYLHSLNPPVQWRAGFVGDSPFYFSCGDCGAKDPVIAGLISPHEVIGDIDVSQVCILGDMKKPEEGGLRMAVFCAECFKARLAGQPPRPYTPPPPPSWPELRHHCPTRTCAGARMKVFGENFENTAWDHWRTWTQHKDRLKRLLSRVLIRHLEKGGTIVEGDCTEWAVRETGFRTPQELADHITNRVVGFGWSVALKP